MTCCNVTVIRDGSIKPAAQAYGKFVTETKFLKRFIDIGKIELATKNYKPLSFKGNINQLSYLVRQLDDNKQDDAHAEAGAETTDKQQAAPQSQADAVNQEVKESANQVAAATSSPSPAPADGEDSGSPWPADYDDDGTLYWPDSDAENDSPVGSPQRGKGETEEETDAPDTPANPGPVDPPVNKQEEREDDISMQTHSIPDDIDSLVKSVHDNLVGTTTASASGGPASGPTADKHSGEPAPDQQPPQQPGANLFEDLLDDLAAADRQNTEKQKQYANDSIQKVDEYKEDEM